MERRNFLRKLFGIGVVAAASKVPALAKEEPEVFKIEDMFEQPFEGNKNLYYLKEDSWLAKEFSKVAGDRIVSHKYFQYYEPATELAVPIKEEYTKADFQQILLYPQIHYHKYDYFCRGCVGGKDRGLFRLTKNEKEGFYFVQFFNARKPE